MIEISFAGLIGAIVGTVIAAINYGVIIGFVERSLRAHDDSKTREERATFETKLTILRRTVLIADIAVFGGIGYWFGHTVAG
jgi:hypothetical protein